MDKILDNLYLGDLNDAASIFRLKQHGVTHILQVAAGFKPMFPKDFKYKVISILDMPYVNIMKHFPTAIQFMKEAISSGGTVFVHCFAGVSRSASCVIAYLMHELGMPFYEAMSYTRKRRPIIFPNYGFQRQLMDFDRLLKARKVLPQSDLTPKRTPQKKIEKIINATTTSQLKNQKIIQEREDASPNKIKQFEQMGKVYKEPQSQSFKVKKSQDGVDIRRNKFEVTLMENRKSLRALSQNQDKRVDSIIKDNTQVVQQSQNPYFHTPQITSNKMLQEPYATQSYQGRPKTESNLIYDFQVGKTPISPPSKTKNYSPTHKQNNDFEITNSSNQQQQPTTLHYVCQSCQAPLFTGREIIEHNGYSQSYNFMINSGQMFNGHASQLSECACIFIVKKEWISEQISNPGAIECPRKTCGAKLGQYSWNGLRCNCGRFISPAFQILKSKVKAIQIQNPSLASNAQSDSTPNKNRLQQAKSQQTREDLANIMNLKQKKLMQQLQSNVEGQKRQQNNFFKSQNNGVRSSKAQASDDNPEKVYHLLQVRQINGKKTQVRGLSHNSVTQQQLQQQHNAPKKMLSIV